LNRCAAWVGAVAGAVLLATGAVAATVTNAISMTFDNEDLNYSVDGVPHNLTQNNQHSVRTNIAVASDLSVTKSASPDPVVAGTDLTYTITVTNAGPSNAPNATLSDPLPAGTTFVSLPPVAGWSCTPPAVGSAGTVSCTAASFTVGSAVFTLTVAVLPSTTGPSLSNTVTVGSAASDPDGTNNSAQVSTAVTISADLSVTKSATPDPVAAGANVTYTITATNAGPSDASAATLADPLPIGTTFVSLVSPGGWSCTAPAVGATGTVNCSATTFAAGGSAVFTLIVAVPASAAAGPLGNQANVGTATSDPNSANDAAVTTTAVVRSADLSVTKSAAPNAVAAGTQVTYTITATNAGPSDATNATISDALPGGITFVSLANPPGWTCTTPAVGATGTVDCSSANFAVGSAVFTLVGEVPLTTPGGSLTNTVVVASASGDPATGNESSAAVVAVGGAPVTVIPTLGVEGLAALALLIGGWAVLLVRRSRRT